MPVRVSIGGVRQWLRPTEIWGSTRLGGGRAGATLVVDPDFYITARELTRAIPDVSARLHSDGLERNHFLRTGT